MVGVTIYEKPESGYLADIEYNLVGYSCDNGEGFKTLGSRFNMGNDC